MQSLTVFEAGMRSESGRYAEFITSPDRKKVDDYIEIMKVSKPEGMTIVFLEKTYQLVSTTPHIVGV